MRKLSLFVIALTVLFSSTVYANHYANFYVIPVAAHTPGANGTNWMSDVAIQNFSPTALTVQIAVIESGLGNPDNVFPLTTASSSGSVTVPPLGNVLLSDVLNGHRGMAVTTGALLIGADRPFAVTSRTYSMSPGGDTVGQTVMPAANFLDNTLSPIDLASAVAYIPGIVQNDRFRTNLGMVAANGNASGGDMMITVTLRDNNGGSVGTRNFSIPAGSIVHVQFPATSVGTRVFDIGSADFRITAGTGSVSPYASVIDNRTGDAGFIAGMFPQNQSAAAFKTFVPSLFRTILDRTNGY